MDLSYVAVADAILIGGHVIERTSPSSFAVVAVADAILIGGHIVSTWDFRYSRQSRWPTRS